jgi:regulator of PEP synthase PpsR (kinase-PPPase family)
MPRLRALSLSAERLAAIRQARYPDSRYASLEQCRTELAAAERLFAQHGLPVIDTTRMSVEEIAARLRIQP